MAVALLDASLVAMLGVVTVSDLRRRVVPNRALVLGLGVAVTLCALDDPATLPERAVAAIGAGGFLLAAALVRPGGMGLGDVKLAGVLGVYLGAAVLAALLAAFAAGSIAGLAVVGRHGWAGRSRTIPFAPFLALGALVALPSQP